MSSRPATAMVYMATLATALLSQGCSVPEPDEARRDWLVNTLIADNRASIGREPDLVQGKFAKMASGLYPFFRGTVRQYQRDVQELAAANAQTAYGTADSALVLILGDPHPENIGTYRTGTGDIIVEFNDFDASTYGPYFFDVRRLALGFAIGAASIADQAQTSSEDWYAAGAAAATGYVTELERMAAGSVPMELTAGDGPIFERLLKKARENGDELEKLNEYTELNDAGERVMILGELEEPDGIVISDEVRAVSADERAMVAELVAGFADSLTDSGRAAVGGTAGLAIKGVSRRLGAGVSSYAILRYYALLEGPTTGTDDDLLIEIKESGDALVFDRAVALEMPSFASNGERIASLQRWFQGRDDADPLSGWALSGRLSVKTRHRTSYQRGISMSRIAGKIEDGDWTHADYVELATHAGRLLARCHALGVTAHGKDSLPVIREALAGDYDGFVAETDSHVRTYAPMIIADHARLVDLLETEGPLLGFRPTRP